MKKIFLYIGVILMISVSVMFGQEVPKLKVTEKDMNMVIFRCAGDNETVVEIQSNVPLTFESTLDKEIAFCNIKEENGFFFYELLFSTDKKYKGRKLKIKSYGFDTYMQLLDLEDKIPVGLLVINDTKRKADDLYDAGKFSEALKEYEKVYSINPKDAFVERRINQCHVFSQEPLREFTVEKDDNPQVFYKGKGCTPDVGVVVFYTTIPDLKFSLPDFPSRLKNVSVFDKENNCYVLCMQPTDTRIGGIMQYSISITGAEYKPMPAYPVSRITPGAVQYFKIKIKEDLKGDIEYLRKEIAELKKKPEEKKQENIETIPIPPTQPPKKPDNLSPPQQKEAKELTFVFSGVIKKNDPFVKIYLDNQLIGETNFALKYVDTNPGIHTLRLVRANYEWNDIINTTMQTDFKFEYKKTGFEYKSYEQSPPQQPKTKDINLTVSTDTLLFTDIGEDKLIEVLTNAKDYKVLFMPKWIKAFKLSDGSLRISCDKNTKKEPRKGSFNIVAGKREIKISVVQEASKAQSLPQQPKAKDIYLTVSTDKLLFTDIGEDKLIEVLTNAKDYKVRFWPHWIRTIKLPDGNLQIYCEKNTKKEPRKGSFNIVAGKKEIKISVVQEASKAQSLSQQPKAKDINLTVSTDRLLFTDIGEDKLIEVLTNAKDYKVLFMPKWIKAFKLSDGSLQISCDKNTKKEPRKGSFNIVADKREIKISVVQEASKAQSLPQQPKAKDIYLTVSTDKLLFSDIGEDKLIEVLTNAKDYKVLFLPKWIRTIKLPDGNLQIYCERNTKKEPRKGSFNIVADKREIKISVVQEASKAQSLPQQPKAKDIYLTVSTDKLLFSDIGEDKLIEVLTNAKDYKVLFLPKWIKAFKRPDGSLRISCDKNTKKEPRKGSFNIVAGKREIKISVVQEASKVQSPPKQSTKKDTYLIVSVDTLLFAGMGEDKLIEVSTNEENYDVVFLPKWLKTTMLPAGNLLISCQKNAKKEPRKSHINIVAGEKKVSINVVQEASDMQPQPQQLITKGTYLTVSPDTLLFAGIGEDKLVEVSTNDINYDILSRFKWIKVTKLPTGNLLVSCNRNTKRKPRKGSFNIIALADGNIFAAKSIKIKVAQDGINEH